MLGSAGQHQNWDHGVLLGSKASPRKTGPHNLREVSESVQPVKRSGTGWAPLLL